MPLEIGDLATKTRPVPVEWMGEEIEVVYKVAELTPAYQSTLQKINTKNLDQEEQWEIILKILASWDITEGGLPAPLAKKTFAKLPTSLLMAIVNALIEDINPNPKSGKPSAAGSFQKGK